MREILTILAAAVLAVLVAALAVPPLIDWSAYGETFARRLGTTLGGQVKVAGPVSVRLLPSPRFEVARLGVTAPGYTLEADHASLELGLVPLLRGVVSVTTAQLDRPRITLDVRALKGAASGAPPTVGIERLVLRDATLAATGDGAVRQLEHVDLTASAETAAGPFKADGYLRAGTRILPFHLATGAVAMGKLPVKLVIEPLAGLPRVEAAGLLLWDAPGPRAQGSIVLSGQIPGVARDPAAPPMPWRAKIDGQATSAEGRADTLELRLGDDDSKLVATGAGAIGPDRAVSVSLMSERPDFDRFRAVYDPSKLVGFLGGTSSDAAASIEWRADAALLGGEVVSGLHLATARPRAVQAASTAVTATATLPRGSTFAFHGQIDRTGHGTGDIELRSDSAPALARWATTLMPSGGTLPQMPFDSIDLAGHVNATADGIEATNVRARLDRSELRGRLSMSFAGERTPARVEAILTSPALDIDALPDLGGAAGAVTAFDVAVSLDAKAIRVARVGRGAVDAGRIVVSFNRSGDTVSLDRLDLDDVGGATARVHGQLTPGRARLAGVLEAQQLATLATLARRVAPSITADALAARATALAPAKLDFELDAAAAAGIWRPSWISLSGTTGGTRLSAIISPARDRQDGVAGTLTLDAPDAAPLLRQIGFPVLPVRGLGGGQVEARLSGKPGELLTIAATARLAGATVGFDGVSSIDPDAPSANGSVRVSAADLSPLLRILGASTDLLAPQPIDAHAHFEGTRDRLALSAIQGLVGPSLVTGDLTRDGMGPVAGALRLDRLDAASLAGLLLGPLQPPAGDRLWSPLKFAPQPPDPPVAAVDLSVGRLAFGTFGGTTNARARVTIGPRTVEARDFRAGWANGTIGGNVLLRRQGETVSLQADVTVADVAVSLPWAQARASGQAELAGAGATPAGLIGSLAGHGDLRLTDVLLAGADPSAPVRVAADVDAERIELDPRKIETALARELAVAPHAVAARSQPVTIAAGQALVAPFESTWAAGDATLSARFDLSTGRIELRDTLRPTAPEGWTGPPPAVALAWAGPVASPSRTTDASGLIETLATHGLAREQARIAAIEVDQRERSFFNRRLKSERAGEAERRADEARLEAVRLEAVRQEATRQEAARQEAARQEAARQEAARQELARKERERRALETAPLDVRPRGTVAPATPTPSIIAPDPSAAGRY